MRKLVLSLACLALVLPAACVAEKPSRTFEVVVYNVENLFDVDGVSLFDDYQPSNYGPRHLARKLEGVGEVLRRFNDGVGPEIVLLSEVEADQTPESTVADPDAFWGRWPGRTARQLLAADPLDPALAGVSAHDWLLKHLADIGVGPYQIAVGESRPDPTGAVIAQTNVVLSRFPIVAEITHPTEGARGILEVVVEIDGHRLILLNNHWKSGASDPATEPVRIGNATVLRQRLDEILRADPHADVILGGDFNSQYNQSQRYPHLPRTAMNDVLGSQGDELALRQPGGPDLYNLWFELPHEQRGSDVWRDEWGTLMQMLITRGLHDGRGVQYVDNTFTVSAFPGLNADAASGRPVRWQFVDSGFGFSDHFPVAARFRVVPGNEVTAWMELDNPSRTATGPAEGVPVRYSFDDAVDLAKLPAGEEFRTVANLGRFFRVSGRVVGVRPFRIALEGRAVEIGVWIHAPAPREAFMGRHQAGDRIEFIGELGQHRGEWQFVIPGTLAR